MPDFKTRFTLIELLIVLLIMVLTGALVMGRLAALPGGAVMGDLASRIDGLFRFAASASTACNRPVEVVYDPGSNAVTIATPLELDESDYGEQSALPESDLSKADAVYAVSDLVLPRHGKTVKLPEGCALEFEPDADTAEDLIASAARITFESETTDEKAPELAAVFYPDGAAEGRRWRLRSGRAVIYSELSGLSGGLISGDAPVSEWRGEVEQ